MARDLHKVYRACMIQERRERQRAIVDLLRQNGPSSSHEVAESLSEIGFEASPATVARDLDQIGAVKVRRDGRVGYTLPENDGGRKQATERLRRIFAEWVQAVEPSGNLIVVRTPPGSAHLVAFAIDQTRFPEVVGTIAGDDALFIAIRSDLPPEPLALRLRDLMSEH
jgi:transcriptional regulator of arginine metabolism